ncbi:MAG: hypothetical protein IIB71_13720 [Proteobacteria bacterium]|nr:hypothetical protein [Pseudomonadota bacterium]
MKSKLIVLTTALLVSMLALAHDPKEHAKESEAPDCQTLASMDHAKMDMDDAVMQAMQARCKEVMTEDHSDELDEDKRVEEDAHAHATEDDSYDDHD